MRLTDCFMEIIAYTGFVARGGQGLTYDLVRANMQHLITQSEACLEKGQFPPEDRSLARFAVFAWVDETILSSAWEGRKQWQREQLQRHYFQTADAGELFFERLNSIGPHQRDVRELYYLCLALGFSGQYCKQGDDFMLEQLRSSNLKLLTGSSMGLPALDREELFPEAYPQQQPDSPPAGAKAKRWPAYALVCTAAPVVLYGLLFFIYKFILSNIGGNLMGTVQ
jgi:type VI secretion system protein ImpK